MVIQKERAIIIGVNVNNDSNFKKSLKELENLALACDFLVVGQIEQNLKEYNRVSCIGKGKIEEVAEEVGRLEAAAVIFDDELTPLQLKNLEQSLECTVLDRTYLILEIFGRRARTREAKLQVEAARLKYMMPRLIGSRLELGRQGGGAGLRNRGAGETKLELDKRRIEERLVVLNKELENLQQERETQRNRRSKAGIKTVAIVGYTNAGKSTLMNAFVESACKDDEKKVLEKDMLFATLETSVRNIALKDKKEFLLSDTVGFVGKLPHELIKAFRATLMEAKYADLLLHVVDVSDENYMEHMKVTNETLEQMGVKDVPVIHVYNKAGLTEIEIPAVTEQGIYLSAKSRIGMEELGGLIVKHIFGEYVEAKFLIPYDKGNLVSYLNQNADIKQISYDELGTVLEVSCKESDYKRLCEYSCQAMGKSM